MPLVSLTRENNEERTLCSMTSRTRRLISRLVFSLFYWIHKTLIGPIVPDPNSNNTDSHALLEVVPCFPWAAKSSERELANLAAQQSYLMNPTTARTAACRMTLRALHVQPALIFFLHSFELTRGRYVFDDLVLCRR